MILKEENVSLMIKAIYRKYKKKQEIQKKEKVQMHRKGTELFTIYLKHIYARQRQGDLIG